MMTKTWVRIIKTERRPPARAAATIIRAVAIIAAVAIAVAATALFSPAARAEISVDVNMPETQISPDEATIYEVTVTTEGVAMPKEVDVHFPVDLLEAGVSVDGPSISTSSSINIIGMRVQKTQTRVYRYALSFDKAGTYDIAGVTVVLDGDTRELKTVTVSVDAAHAERTSPRDRRDRRDRDQLPSPFGWFDRFFDDGDSIFSPFRRTLPRPPRPSDVIFVIQPASDDVWVGEAVWLRLIVYVNEAFQVYQFAPRFELPDNTLFWMEEIPQTGVATLRQTGEGDMAAYQIGQYVLFPLRPGEETIEKAAVLTQLSRTRAPTPIESRADPVTIRARRLPPPAPEAALVADVIDVRFDLDRRQDLYVDQPLSFTYMVEGMANLRKIESVPIVPADDVDVVMRGDEFEYTRDPSRFRLRKSGFLIFRTPGTHIVSLDPVRYFDPVREKYHEVGAGEWTLDVSAGVAPGASVVDADTDSAAAAPAHARPSAGDVLAPLSREGAAAWRWLIAVLAAAALVLAVLAVWVVIWTRRQVARAKRELTASSEPAILRAYRQHLQRHGETAPVILAFLAEQGIFRRAGARSLKGAGADALAALLSQPAYQELIERFQALRYAPAARPLDSEDDARALELGQEVMKIIVNLPNE